MFKILRERVGIEEGKMIRQYLIEDETDLASLPNDTAPSSLAHTAAYGGVWELGLDGEWHEVSQSGGGGGGSTLAFIIGSDNGNPYIEG